MLSFVPWYYQDSKIMTSILDASGYEFDDLRKTILSFINQMYVDTADESGIEIWEKELGISPKDSSLNLRKSFVKVVLSEMKLINSFL